MKLTPERLKEILLSRPTEVSEEELKEAFFLIGFRVKEYKKTKSSVFFDVSHNIYFLTSVRSDNDSKFVSFDNEFVSFTDDADGFCIPADNIKDIIVIIKAMIMYGMRIQDRGLVVNCIEDQEYNENEFRELAEVFNSMLNKQKKP